MHRVADYLTAERVCVCERATERDPRDLKGTSPHRAAPRPIQLAKECQEAPARPRRAHRIAPPARGLINQMYPPRRHTSNTSFPISSLRIYILKN